MSPLDEVLLSDALAVRERCTELELQLAQQKADFGRAVRRLHASGASLREIAGALELSHQRVHQLIGTSEPEGWIARLTPGRKPVRRRSSAACSFCEVSEVDTARLVAGPGVYICDKCIRTATLVAIRNQPSSDSEHVRFTPVLPQDHGVRCDFCSRGLRRSERIWRGGRHGHTICDQCLRLCSEILAEPPLR